jgi:hypothetical protein
MLRRPTPWLAVTKLSNECLRMDNITFAGNFAIINFIIEFQYVQRLYLDGRQQQLF